MNWDRFLLVVVERFDELQEGKVIVEFNKLK